MKSRRISPRELADLSERWNNEKVDTSKYYSHVQEAYEVDDEILEIAKQEGELWQTQDGFHYVGLERCIL